MRKSLALGIILLIAFFVRIWQVDKFPAGFTADEAAQGYTAYSLLKTGHDEWGKLLPIAPRSFGDFKPPLYTYLTIPSVALFGLNEFAVRLPAVILGTLSVLATFLMVKELFKNTPITYHLSLITSLFLAISPWHINLSRGAFESNLTTFFLPLGFYFFLKGLAKRRFLFVAAAIFGLNLFTYHSARLITPLFFLFLLLWKRKTLFSKNMRANLVAFLIFGVFLVVTVFGFFAGAGTRVSDIGIFSAGFEIPKIFLSNYLSYLSPEFLFTHGAGEATYGMIPGRGVLYWFELVFLLFTFVSLTRKWNQYFLPLLFLVLVSPIPAALASGVGYHANRVAIMMPAIQIFSAYGAIILFDYLKKIFSKPVLLPFYSSTLLLFLSFFLYDYFYHSPKISAPAMLYGWNEAMKLVSRVETNYEKVVISRSFSEPQAFIAFYKKWEPIEFQRNAGNWLKYQEKGMRFVDQLGDYSLGKYEFRSIDWNQDRNLSKTLFVGKESDFPGGISLNKRIIPYPNGQPAFLIVGDDKIL